VLWSASAPVSVAFQQKPASEEPAPAPEEDDGVELAALDTIPVPLPDDLDAYIKDKDAAILLGKSLFWDTQVGSDGKVACATCHWHAGADARTRNTLNPGAPGSAFGPQRDGQAALNELAVGRFRGANADLQAEDFPFHRVKFPTRKGGDDNPVIFDIPEVVGSQGVIRQDFLACVEGSPVDEGNLVEDPVFQIDGVNAHLVTGRNTPTTINAVFNDRQFWDGRAQRIFNGVNPFGDLDPNARVLRRELRNNFDDKLTVIFEQYPWAASFEDVFRRYQWIVYWFLPTGFQGIDSIEPVRIRIEKASLACQAVGPPLSDVEMSWMGRAFPELGRKMFSLAPLAQQEVHPDDSVLGSYANENGKGLNGVGYADLVRDAFQDEWWKSQVLTDAGFTQMEANFSLYWGLSILLYESTLVSDDSPFDRHQKGDKSLSKEALRGLDIFVGAGKCVNCHGGPEFTGATVSQIRGALSPEPDPIEFMLMQRGPEAFYDNGFYNIGVRQTLEDLGVGAAHPDFGPLSFTRQRQNGRDVDQDIDVPQHARVAVDGAFKTPTLRNIELTGPYMHNGGMRTLTEVVQFYTRRADFFKENIDDLDPDVDGIEELQENPAGIADVVAFLKSLTDERVRFNKAPFDHPELVIANGHTGVRQWKAADNNIVLPAVGRDGGDEVLPFDEIVAGDSPTDVEPKTEEGNGGEEPQLDDAEQQRLLDLLKDLKDLKDLQDEG
jgi:cytochrome c peroxidase